MTNEPNIAALRALESKACRGDWFVYGGSIAIEECDPETGPYPTQLMEGGPDDMAFVCALRNAAPSLLAAAEERDRLRQLIPVECCNGSDPNCYGPFGCLVRAHKAQTTDKQKLVDEVEEAKAERDALKAENERLREALNGNRLRREVERLQAMADERLSTIKLAAGALNAAALRGEVKP